MKKIRNIINNVKNTIDGFKSKETNEQVATVVVLVIMLAIPISFIIEFGFLPFMLAIFLTFAVVIIQQQSTAMSPQILYMKLDYFGICVGKALRERLAKSAYLGSEPPKGKLEAEDNKEFVVSYLLPTTKTLLPDKERLDLAEDIKNQICNELYNSNYADIWDSQHAMTVQVLKDHHNGLMLVRVAVGKRFIYGLNV